MSLRPQLQALLDDLKARGPGALTLDELADALAATSVSYAEIELLIGALEDAGVLVDAPEPIDLSQELAQVLTAARALAAELGRAPSVQEIAPRAGLRQEAVRRALRFATVLAR